MRFRAVSDRKRTIRMSLISVRPMINLL